MTIPRGLNNATKTGPFLRQHAHVATTLRAATRKTAYKQVIGKPKGKL